jgi:hypothetical protein
VFLNQAAGKVKTHLAPGLLEMMEFATEVNTVRWEGGQQHVQQIGSARAYGGDVKLAKREVHQNLAAACANQEVGVRTAARQHFVEQAEVAQDAGSVRPEHHSGADFVQAGRSFIDGGVDAGPVQSYGGRDSADAASDDGDVGYGCLTWRRWWGFRT